MTKFEVWCSVCNKIKKPKAVYLHGNALNVYLPCGHDTHTLTIPNRVSSSQEKKTIDAANPLILHSVTQDIVEQEMKRKPDAKDLERIERVKKILPSVANESTKENKK